MTDASRVRAERLWRTPLFSLGAILLGFGLLMAFTGLFDLAEGESPRGDLAAALLACFIGVALLITCRRGSETRAPPMSLRSAFLVTALGWLAPPVFAAAPFMFAPEPLSITDAVFEAVSGLTTTGSTVIVGLDDYPKGLLLWRSMLQWIGGVGIIVMAVVLLPFLRVGGMQLFQMESSEQSAERAIPQSATLIAWIVAIYAALTIVCTVAFAAAGMIPFDAVNHAMTTVSTGGYSTHDLSLGAYDRAAVRWVAVVFMIGGALPFTLYVWALRGGYWRALGDAQARWFLMSLAVLVVAVELARLAGPAGQGSGALSHTALNIVSIVTTTGFVSQDYQLWGAGAAGLFFVLFFLGGCAGSTSGAIKTYRFQLLFLITRDYMRRLHEPHAVRPLRYAGKVITPDVSHAVLAFIAIYVGAVSVGSLALSWTGLDLVTALSGAAQAIGNVGPGLGEVIGPSGNFASIPWTAKWVLIGLMLIGRLELFAILVLFDPRFWRR